MSRDEVRLLQRRSDHGYTDRLDLAVFEQEQRGCFGVIGHQGIRSTGA